MARIDDLHDRRLTHMHACGLDAFSQSAEVWLSMAVGAEGREHKTLQADYETAMDIANCRLALSTVENTNE